MAKDSKKKEEKVTKSDVNKKNKKSGFKDFKAELKKVVWPTPKELLNSTTAVIVIVLVTAIIVFALDVLFESLNNNVIDRIRTTVSESVKSDENTNNSNQEVVLNNNSTNSTSNATNEAEETQNVENESVENKNTTTEEQ